MAYTYTNPHKQTYQLVLDEKASLEQELKDVTERANWITERLAQIEQYLKAVAPFLEEDPGGVTAQVGLTEMCRNVLAKNSRWMTAAEVRKYLSGVGIDLTPYSNPMAVLHSVLARVGQKQRGPDGALYYGADNLIWDPFAQGLIRDPLAEVIGESARAKPKATIIRPKK